MTAVNKLWTFPKIADTAAQERHGERWRLFAEDYLGDLVADFWRNRFHQVFHRSKGFVTRTPDTITREEVWRLLEVAKPPAFHDFPERDRPDWEALAQVAPEDYGPGLSPPGIRSTFLATLLLPEAEARDWIRKQGKAKHPRGRPQKYDWIAFLQQVARIANTPHGLPEKQADLERCMLEWCANNWGEEPAESVIREKLAPLYDNGEAGK